MSSVPEDSAVAERQACPVGRYPGRGVLCKRGKTGSH